MITEWQAARDSAFKSIIAQSLGDARNNMSIRVPSGTGIFYKRVRHFSAISGPSAWSAASRGAA